MKLQIIICNLRAEGKRKPPPSGVGTGGGSGEGGALPRKIWAPLAPKKRGLKGIPPLDNIISGKKKGMGFWEEGKMPLGFFLGRVGMRYKCRVWVAEQ